jgi:hypothetical protein
MVLSQASKLHACPSSSPDHQHSTYPVRLVTNTLCAPLPPQPDHRCCAGLGCGLGGLLFALLLLSCCCQLAAAQNYTALRQGVWLPPLCKIDNITEAKEYDGLLEKLPQIKNTPAEQQLQLLSANSRSKLNNLTGNAAEVCLRVHSSWIAAASVLW